MGGMAEGRESRRRAITSLDAKRLNFKGRPCKFARNHNTINLVRSNLRASGSFRRRGSLRQCPDLEST
jgi:hypothetical protein